MSDTGQQDRAYPRTSMKETSSCIVLPQCGGKGGGICAQVIGYTKYVWAYHVSRFDVYNRKLILKNDGLDVYTDGGALGDCDHTANVRQPWWLAFGVDDTLTDAEIMAQGLKFTDAAPFEIEVREDKLPQPTDTGWDGKIYIYVYWGNSNFVGVRFNPVLEVLKHDFDIKV